ncbi:hypothetical protein [Comamonas terrigena]|uniref:hypothetical protein n=1 Tax=Comamonas terrigena TaxID=32013 RepID=UPI00244889A7|nr:hypothetical protein [Comamonas terrigena]MDH0051247.1 hypothetical protein [Comamonas terrigena]MDH0513696.1 hypothetical protein [Comamonas terrigena]MDH1093198.1 hypothetical protein [Comamonas terrigena]MDH1502446.1 hypothetical protein [Comamonas terrigena]
MRKKCMDVSLRSTWLRMWSLVAACLLCSIQPVCAQSASQVVPGHWIAYAQFVGEQFQDRLDAPDSPAAMRLRDWMLGHQRVPASDQPDQAPSSAVLTLRVWVAPSGKVAQLELMSAEHEQVDADLWQLLAAKPLRDAPPVDLLQPMTLELTLDMQ